MIRPRQPCAILTILSIAIVVMMMILAASGTANFANYFGNIQPVTAIVLLVMAGGLALIALDKSGVFKIFRKKTLITGVVRAVQLASLFAVAVIVADLVLRYPENINVGLPQALLFYPVMAYAAEMAFHAIPLAMLVLIVGLLAGPQFPNGLAWFLIFAVALLEPAFQLGLNAMPLSALGFYTGLHVFAINLVQLYLFKRYDFVAMLTFRLAYYFSWHIAWGFFRVALLFETR